MSCGIRCKFNLDGGFLFAVLDKLGNILRSTQVLRLVRPVIAQAS